MGVVFQGVVTGDSKYSFPNDPTNVIFDAHNDSVYNMGISFGRDTGILNADYFTSPHSVLYGVPIPGNNLHTLGGVKFTGMVYLYTQTPIGASNSTILSSAPAASITMIGYPQGSTPQATTSLNRWNAIGNAINTVGGTASAIQNDGNAPGTNFIEATPSGDANSTVSLDTSGNLVLGDATHPGSITSDNSKLFTDGTGFLTLVKLLATSGILNSSTDIIFQSAGGEIGRVTSGTNGGALNLPGAQRTINGSTSGTCTCYQLFTGPFKICIFQFNNWRNGAAGNQFISVPIAYTFGEHGINGGCGTFQLIKSGGAQTVQILTTLAAGGGGVSGVTSVNNNSIWHCDTGFDSLALAGSDAGAHTGTLVIFGI